MICKDSKIVVIKPPTRIKYKKFCKNIYRKYSNQYISYTKDGKQAIDIPFLMDILVRKLKPHIDVSYICHKKYQEIDFINGIIEVITNCSYWNRYNGKITGKYLNKRHHEYYKWGCI